MKYNLVQVEDGGEANLTVVHDGEMYVATDSHPNFQRIVAGLAVGDESVVELFDVQKTAQRRFDRLSERVTVANGKVYLDGEEADNALTQQVIHFVNQGVEDFKPLVAFFEKVETNPNSHSREQLYTWLRDRNITLTEDGNFIAYKGVRVENDEYFSISTGKAISNGVEYNGAIPNPLGAIVEMPRSEVQHNPAVGCHTGLHAGTWGYASGFARGAVLTVEINPRDVVSVPTDCDAAKLRVCRYIVKDVTETELDAAVYSTYPDLDGYDDEEYDDYGYEDDDEPDVDTEETPQVQSEEKEVTESTGVVTADVSSAITWRPVESNWAPEDPDAPWNRV
ncbi:rIIB-like protein [Streptomyces phage Comrade]|uniref:RIIB-like protein n=1 Tax=Streptomyces phage Comrade TaxID=2301714 RepID=A0A385DXA2_9CAUD|nr:rIIB-like protein [Streptomyces phage Comrade]AXQ63408.1 rIIB-like protein [Streptomyces phage Comrade]